MSRFVVGIPWVLFVYPLCVSRCNIYLVEKEIMINSRWRSSSSRALVLLQDGGHAHANGGASIHNSRWRVPSLKFNVVTA